MYGWYEKLFYTFSAVFLGAALFALHPSENLLTTSFQIDIQHEFGIATVQVFGDQPFILLEDMEFVILSIDEFYQESADAMIALLTPPATEDDLIAIANGTYQKFASIFDSKLHEPQVSGVSIQAESVIIPVNFMEEEPIYNILLNCASPTNTQTKRKIASCKHDYY